MCQRLTERADGSHGRATRIRDMAALSLRPTLTEVLKVLTPCHGATRNAVESCTIQGHVSLSPHGWDAPISHGREDFAAHAPLPKCDETRVSCVDCGSRTRSLHLLSLRLICQRCVP